MEYETEQDRSLGTDPVGRLLLRFAIPSCITMLIGSIYNIIDQFFIGHTVGILGNSATNVAFPFTTICTALALLFGVGGASFFNLSMGRREYEKCPWIIGGALTLLVVCSSVFAVLCEVFLVPVLNAFGATAEVLPYAVPYVRICAIGIPALVLTGGGGHLIRADGSPQITMACSVSGAVINVVFDALFVMVFRWGMAGAALATILGQFFSAGMVIWYFRYRVKTVRLQLCHLRPRWDIVRAILPIGAGMSFNQLANLVMQVTLNNSLRYYGALTVYGSEIALAAAGISGKIGFLTMSLIIGIAQGSQPVMSYNYGARQYDRVKRVFVLACLVAAVPALLSFSCFQLIPDRIFSLFGSGSAEYVQCGVLFLRVYFCMACINFMQPVTSTLFTALGYSVRGAFLSLTRQILFLLPLMLILPRFFGYQGILYSAPIADSVAFFVALAMVRMEFRAMK